MRFTSLKLSTKLSLSFAVLVVVVVGFSAMVFRNLHEIEASDEANQHVARVLSAATALSAAVSEQSAIVHGYLVSQDPARVEQFGKLQKTFDERAAALDGLVKVPAMREKMEATVATARVWQATGAELMKLAARPDTMPKARAIFNQGTSVKQMNAFRTAFNDLQAGEEAIQAERTATNDAAQAQARTTLLAGGALVAVLAGLVGYLLTRAIASPIKVMTGVMLRLAEGDDEVAVPSRDRLDEVGAMAKAVQVFKDAAIENKRLEAEASAAREAQEAQRDRQSAIDNAKADDLKNFVHDVEESFRLLAAGDLTARMHRAVAPEFEPIRSTFNASVESLEDAIASVVSSIGAIRTGLSEINVASNDLAQRTEQQAASLEETVAALSEVTAGVNDMASGAGRAQGAAETTKASAQTGGAVVERAIAAMSEIEKSSQQINQIIGVIDEIAFQTNLLALNAGVEAARAGEAGKGFAVVASEVRGLAQRSAEAAKEIKGLISVSRDQVEAGVELVSASGASLKEIVAQVGEMNQLVTGIAGSAREQAVSLKEVSTAADQMDKVTQQNAAMVEEATAAAQALSNETDELAQLIQRFRTKASSDMVPAGSKAGTRRTAPRGVVQMRTAGRGGAAPATASKASEDWAEF